VPAVATSERQALVTDPPAAVRSAPRLFEPRSGGVSLEDSILRTWEDLTGRGDAGCPVCGGRMRAAAACESCGSDLS
jgi:tRNA(Ile2) C34 agmatinyltransferase TiaS